jgi:hypothetical protein
VNCSFTIREKRSIFFSSWVAHEAKGETFSGTMLALRTGVADSAGGMSGATGGKSKQYYRQYSPWDLYESKRPEFAECWRIAVL